MDKLTISERTDLIEYEEIIQEGLKTFYEVGKALALIRDDHLYRHNHATFEDYCQDRWQIDRTYAHRIISASIVADNVLPIGNIEYESQARPLIALEPEHQRIVWDVVQKTAVNGKVTAAHVKSIVSVFKGALKTGAIDPGTGEEIPLEKATAFHWINAITEETYERYQRQKTHISDSEQKKNELQLPLTEFEIKMAMQAILSYPSDQDVARTARSLIRCADRKAV